MTREEAIEVLRNESVQISGDAITVARWTSALDVAIRVLENMTDLKRRPCYLRCPYNTPKGCMVVETNGDCILNGRTNGFVTDAVGLSRCVPR